MDTNEKLSTSIPSLDNTLPITNMIYVNNTLTLTTDPVPPHSLGLAISSLYRPSNFLTSKQPSKNATACFTPLSIRSNKPTGSSLL